MSGYSTPRSMQVRKYAPLLEFVSGGRRTMNEIAAHLGVSQVDIARVRRRVERLEDDGLVEHAGWHPPAPDKRPVGTWRATARGLLWLENHKEKKVCHCTFLKGETLECTPPLPQKRGKRKSAGGTRS